jgi:hypothetical protein
MIYIAGLDWEIEKFGRAKALSGASNFQFPDYQITQFLNSSILRHRLSL